MEFDLFDPEALNLNEISSMLQDSSFNVGRENASMSSGNSTLIGNSLDALEGSSIWSPTTHNSSGASFSPHSSSPPSRSFENTGIWSPSYHNSSSSPSYASSSNSPPERLIDALNLNGPSIWSHNPTSPTANNASSTLSRSSSSPPPGLANLANLAFNNNSVLNMKQTIQALNFLQELQEASQNIPWDGARANENASLTAALQQHLLTHLLKQSPPTPTPPSPTNDNLLRSVRFHRENAGMNEPRCTWSGQLPARNHKNPIYSCKVFLGGVPYEVSISTLLRTFRAYGNVKLEWPGKEDTPSAPKGYAYLIYENERQVKTLLQNCIYHYGKESNWYYKISSKRLRFHSKDIQVIPWAICDSNFVRCQTTKLDPQKTIFVGALHGMINAEALAMIMHELFGGVVYAGIDTDRHKYPIGSGRVTFNNSKSYMKAVSAEFVEIRSSKFTKKVQVDPYLEDATCSVCRLQQGPYFCRSLSCFRYFCRTCFEFQHSGELFQSHRPLMRNASRQPGSSASSSA